MTAPASSQPGGVSLALKCPVCAAGFRGVEICPRCGTNLEPLMQIAGSAWALRQRARAKLRAGDLDAALRSFDVGWKLQHQGQPVSSLRRIAENETRKHGQAAQADRRDPEIAPCISAGSTISSNGQSAEPRQRESVPDRTGESESRADSAAAHPAHLVSPGSADDRRPIGTPWLFGIALAAPALCLITYLLIARRTPGAHNATGDWAALLMVLAVGTAVYWRGSDGRRPPSAAIAMYVLSQALWLAVVGLMFAARQ